MGRTAYSSAADLVVLADGDTGVEEFNINSQIKGEQTKFAEFRARRKAFGKGVSEINREHLGIMLHDARQKAEEWNVLEITDQLVKAYQDMVKSAIMAPNASGTEVLGHVIKGKFKALPGFYSWLVVTDDKNKRIGRIAAGKLVALDRLIAKGADVKDVKFMYDHTREEYLTRLAIVKQLEAILEAI